jgi:hypothetical protein
MIKEMIIRTALNAKFGRYGKVLTLKIDSSNKTIDVDVLLKGETEPIKIRVGQEGKPGLALTNIQTSRPWMTELAAAFGPEILIPIEKAKLLGLVL